MKVYKSRFTDHDQVYSCIYRKFRRTERGGLWHTNRATHQIINMASQVLSPPYPGAFVEDGEVYQTAYPGIMPSAFVTPGNWTLPGAEQTSGSVSQAQYPERYRKLVHLPEPVHTSTGDDMKHRSSLSAAVTIDQDVEQPYRNPLTGAFYYPLYSTLEKRENKLNASTEGVRSHLVRMPIIGEWIEPVIGAWFSLDEGTAKGVGHCTRWRALALAAVFLLGGGIGVIVGQRTTLLTSAGHCPMETQLALVDTQNEGERSGLLERAHGLRTHDAASLFLSLHALPPLPPPLRSMHPPLPPLPAPQATVSPRMSAPPPLAPPPSQQPSEPPSYASPPPSAVPRSPPDIQLQPTLLYSNVPASVSISGDVARRGDSLAFLEAVLQSGGGTR